MDPKIWIYLAFSSSMKFRFGYDRSMRPLKFIDIPLGSLHIGRYYLCSLCVDKLDSRKFFFIYEENTILNEPKN